MDRYEDFTEISTDELDLTDLDEVLNSENLSRFNEVEDIFYD